MKKSISPRRRARRGRGEKVFDYIPFAENDGDDTPEELLLFTLSTCSFCAEALEYLQSRKLRFKWVETDGLPFGLRRRLRNDFIKTFRERMYYPTLVIGNGRIVSGFEQVEWREAIDGENG